MERGYVFTLIVDNSSFDGSGKKDTQTAAHSCEGESHSPLKVVLGSQHIQQAEQLKYEAALNRVISRAQKLDW